MPFASSFLPAPSAAVLRGRAAAARRALAAREAADPVPNTPPQATRHSAADPVVDGAVARAVESFDLVAVGAACLLLFPERFFPFAGPLVGGLLALAVFALGLALRPLGRLAAGALQQRAGRPARLVAAFALLAGCTVGLALVPAWGAAGSTALVLLVACRSGQGLALGACSSGVDPRPGDGPFAPAGWIGALAGALLAAGLLATLAGSLSGPEFRAWGWQYPFLAVLPLSLVALFARLRCG